MKVIDQSENGLLDLAWSPDGAHLAYVKEGVVWQMVVSEGTPQKVAEGSSPGFTAANHIIYEHNDEICRFADGRASVFIGHKDLLAGTAKRRPRVSLNGKELVFVVDNVFHKESQQKNAYPYRSFLGLSSAERSGSARMVASQQWYGGQMTWFPGSTTFMHYEYDSTGGARVHVVSLEGEPLGTMFGLSPSISPDGKRIACKPKGGQAVVIYTLKEGPVWSADQVTTNVVKLPEGGRLSGSPPQWLDNRLVLVDEGGKLFRVDTRNGKVDEPGKVPVPVLRGTATMAVSPSRQQIVVERAVDDGFELVLAQLG